jgi:hypothetical protein
MCGIVGYFGDRANGLCRVLGAMASILYRAPDSTGIAWFGDQAEPIRIRKTVGALSRFVETQLSEETHPGEAEILVSLLTEAKATVDPGELQKALLRWQGLAKVAGEGPEQAAGLDLLEEGGTLSGSIVPGICGTAGLRKT